MEVVATRARELYVRHLRIHQNIIWIWKFKKMGTYYIAASFQTIAQWEGKIPTPYTIPYPPSYQSTRVDTNLQEESHQSSASGRY